VGGQKLRLFGAPAQRASETLSMPNTQRKMEEINQDNAAVAQAPPSNQTTNSVEDMAGMTKSQKKKLLRQQKWEASKEQRKEHKKIKKQERRRRLAAKAAETGLPAPRRRHIKQKPACPLRVVIDFSFEDLMTAKEQNNITTQIARCYSSNRRADKPVTLCFSKFEGIVEDKMAKKFAGFESWTVNIQQQDYLSAWASEKEKIVYLSSESDNVVEEFQQDHIYVIGGIIDRNRHKGVTQERADRAGIRTARLPLDKYVTLPTRSVLTINQVFEIILGVVGTGDWMSTLKSVLPTRKGGVFKDADLAENSGGSEEDASGVLLSNSDLQESFREDE